MAPIPSAHLPGFKPLLERVLTALRRCEESQSIEFKRSGDWESLKLQIIHTVLGMANLRDGGIIVIGVEQNEAGWALSGISEGHLNSFDVDIAADQINSYISPHAKITMASLSEDGKTFLAIEVHEFHDAPLVCKRSGPANSGLVEGAVYVRPPGVRPQTTRVMRAEQMHDLLELAAEKRSRRFLEGAKRVGMVPEQTHHRRFDEELKGL
jgi:predicted HTH transcriptional regulator